MMRLVMLSTGLTLEVTQWVSSSNPDTFLLHALSLGLSCVAAVRFLDERAAEFGGFSLPAEQTLADLSD